MLQTYQFKTVFNDDTAYVTTKTAKIKNVLLLKSTLTLWRRAAKVIAPFFETVLNC